MMSGILMKINNETKQDKVLDIQIQKVGSFAIDPETMKPVQDGKTMGEK